MTPSSVNAWAGGNRAAHTQIAVYAFAVKLAAFQAQEPRPHEEQPVSTVTSSPTPPPVTVDAASPSSVWDCIATAETGGDYSMHGSTYSTAYGVINDIVYQYATPEEQAEIFSGTASKETQIAVVSRFTAEHGFGGWGELTKQKCGL